MDSLVVKLILYLWQFLPKLLQGNAKFPTECQITFPSRITFLCRHVQFITSEQQDYKLGGFSIGYVHVTSEPTDSQALSFNMVGTILFTVTSSSPPLNGRALSLVTPSRLCPVYHIWTDRCLDLFPFMVLKLSCPVYHLWIDEFITLFSFSPSGLGVLAVKLKQLPLKSELRAWCLLVGYV